MTGEANSRGAITIIDRYVALATKHGEATENGNSVDANALFGELNEVLSQLLRQEQRDALVPLLTHPNLAVRAKAAFHTYVLNPQRSAAVLEEISKQPGLVGFSAGMTLKQLKSGGLTPP